jgi:hypothetical protein
MVELSKLAPPASREVADPAKVELRGEFDWEKYKNPIIVERYPEGRLVLREGMTSKQLAERSQLTHLPAIIIDRR